MLNKPKGKKLSVLNRFAGFRSGDSTKIGVKRQI